MNTPTPTPRTDAAWAQTFDANGFLSGRGNAASQMRDECATLERELTTLTAERDQLNEMFHQIRLKLSLACGDPYKMHDEALDCLIAERDQLRAEVERYRLVTLIQDAELSTEREKVRVLRSALENLCDEQNGPPLEVNRDQWQLAMDESRLALVVTEGAK
jgi:DNA repair exonuclease SbcCD ATPase subunit